jgi:uncharacterized protein (TIGR02996 family)
VYDGFTMPTEEAFLAAIAANPADDLPRLVYADWLDEQNDPRGAFVRLHAELRKLGPDHVHRVPGEEELSRLRVGCDVGWLGVVEPERAHLGRESVAYRVTCDCYDADSWELRKGPPLLTLHVEPQDTECKPWKQLCELVEMAVADGRENFDLHPHFGFDDYKFLVTLPPTIAKLKQVKRLNLYGSGLVRIPPEIGQMTALEDFDPYTSYRLHWYPYEIARCPVLRQSRMSTRALYGNYKSHPPFPSLVNPHEPHALHLLGLGPPVRPCSVCSRPFEDFRQHRVWISLRVATDVMPLLVNACSRECVLSLPTPPDGYHPQPHRGGLGTPRKY